MKKPFENDVEKWNDLHSQLQDMLAGYADDELDNEQVLLVEAHLVGCELCRNDLSRQQILTQRLEVMSSPRLGAQAHCHIDQSLNGTSTSYQQIRQYLSSSFMSLVDKTKTHLSLSKTISASGWGLAFVLAVIIFMPTVTQEKNSQIPMIADALAEYHELEDKVFPTSNIKSNKAPINWPNAHLLATWKTKVAGESAQVYALRSGRNIVFQYHVNESVFFRNPVVRQAIAKSGNYKTQANKMDVIAMPLTNAGILIVGPEDSLPAPEKMIIESI